MQHDVPVFLKKIPEAKPRWKMLFFSAKYVIAKGEYFNRFYIWSNTCVV